LGDGPRLLFVGQAEAISVEVALVHELRHREQLDLDVNLHVHEVLKQFGRADRGPRLIFVKGRVVTELSDNFFDEAREVCVGLALLFLELFAVEEIDLLEKDADPSQFANRITLNALLQQLFVQRTFRFGLVVRNLLKSIPLLILFFFEPLKRL
jgi:hypothetical protein